jgi:nitrile hydratase alpha subunit
MRHDHDHPHDKAHGRDFDEGPPSEYEIMSRAMQELLEEKGVISAEQIRKRMEKFEEDFPYRGSRVIAHAWADAAFRRRLLEDGKAACAEFGLDLEADRLIAVENTPEVHNVIVCTLCSCYPRALLGMPPTWYKSENYRKRVVREPRAVLREFGVELPPETEIRIWDSSADLRYIVVPQRPAGTDDLSEEQLAALVTRESMIGTGLVAGPAA